VKPNAELHAAKEFSSPQLCGQAWVALTKITARNLSEQGLEVDYQLPITDYRLPITHYQLPITNYQLLTIENF
jgi:hypothetical protein